MVQWCTEGQAGVVQDGLISFSLVEGCFGLWKLMCTGMWQMGPQFFISLKGLDMQPITLRFRGRGWGKYHSLNQDLNLQPQFPSPVPLPHGHGTSLLDGREDFIFCWVVSVHRERACWQRLTRARSWWVYLCCVRMGWLIYLYCDMVSIFVLCMVWAD